VIKAQAICLKFILKPFASSTFKLVKSKRSLVQQLTFWGVYSESSMPLENSIVTASPYKLIKLIIKKGILFNVHLTVVANLLT
jgi:hypothetical protein